MYVSSDHDKGAAGTAQLEHGWDFAVPFEDKALRSRLKARYKVWAMIENGEFGKVRAKRCLRRACFAFPPSFGVRSSSRSRASPLPPTFSPKDRTSGIPTIVAVDRKGHVLQHMDVGMEDMGVLDKEWRYKEWAW